MTTSYLDWRSLAACLGEDPELFFPIGSGHQATRQIAEAKAVCRRCPVIARCTEVAVANGYEGIWGGLDDAQRRLLRRGRLIGSCAPRSVLP